MIRSGDMYLNVPTTVAHIATVFSSMRAIPKSVSFTCPRLARKRERGNRKEEGK